MKMRTTVYTHEELAELFDAKTIAIRCIGTFTTSAAGTVPADDKALADFCRHHLGLTDDQIPAAVARIKREELGEKDTTPETGELAEKESYGLVSWRKDEEGRPWLGHWMIKACAKHAWQRLGFSVARKYTKGDLAECTTVAPMGHSAMSTSPERVYLYTIGDEGKATAATTEYARFTGSVGHPTGKVSICNDVEIVAPGSHFGFEMRVPSRVIKEPDLRLMLALMPRIGLGGARSFERGNYRWEYVEITAPVVPKQETKKKKKHKAS